MAIFTGFSPNLTGRDTLKALGYLVLPWKWGDIKRGGNASRVEKELEKYFGVKRAYAFDSGRTALYFALKALDVTEGDEVLVQAYTCVVVINSIRWAGAKPVYVDVGADFNMDAIDLKKKITKKSKAVIIQHTYGLPADLESLLGLARGHGLKVVEDCAHSFGARYKGKLTGTFGDIGMLSFGSDKILSCVRGGALITNDAGLSRELNNLQSRLKPLPAKIIVEHLLHYPVFYIGKAFYGIIIGKVLLWLAKKMKLINKIISREEKQGEPDQSFAHALPNSLAGLLLNQLSEVDKINQSRIKIAGIYNTELSRSADKPLIAIENADECVYLRYPLLVERAEELMGYAKKDKVLLGDWYNSTIAPKDISIKSTGYKKGDCPQAEKLARRIINLPTDRHITERQARKVVKVVNSFLEK